MCYVVTCSYCNKKTWGGCGRHIEQVMKNIPIDQRCTCDNPKKPSSPIQTVFIVTIFVGLLNLFFSTRMGNSLKTMLKELYIMIFLGISSLYFQFTHPSKQFKLPDLSNKVAIITGANTGIGFYTAKRLAEKGATVFIGCRSEEKGRNAIKELKELVPNGKIEFLKLDLSDFSNVKKFAQDFLSLNLPLHILVNNAGVMGCPRTTIENGKIELQFGVNHLGHFLLTMLLLERMKESEPSRIVHVSSYANYGGTINFDDLQLEKNDNYKPLISYCQSKLSNIVFSNELSDKLRGTKVTSNSLHPGDVSTEILRTYISSFKSLKKISDLILRTPEQGSDTSVYLSASDEVEGLSGLFWMECEQFEPNKEALDDEIKKKLWIKSTELLKDYLN